MSSRKWGTDCFYTFGPGFSGLVLSNESNGRCVGPEFYPLLCKELPKFQTRSGTFSRPAEEDATPSSWWRQLPDTGVLRKLGLHIANLKSSSANVERLFSILKLIQNPCRTRISLKTLEYKTCAKLSLTDNEDLSLYDLMVEDERIFEDDLNRQDSRPSTSPMPTPRRVSNFADKLKPL